MRKFYTLILLSIMEKVSKIILALIPLFIGYFASSTDRHISSNTAPTVEKCEIAELSASQPESWKTYTAPGIFSISVPPTVELRNEGDAYSKLLADKNLNMNNGAIIFQQKGFLQRQKSPLINIAE